MFHLNMHYGDMWVRNGFKQLTVLETGNPDCLKQKIPERNCNPDCLKQKIPERNCNRYHGKNRDRTVAVILQLVWYPGCQAATRASATERTATPQPLLDWTYKFSSVEVRPRESPKNHWALWAIRRYLAQLLKEYFRISDRTIELKKFYLKTRSRG